MSFRKWWARSSCGTQFHSRLVLPTKGNRGRWNAMVKIMDVSHVSGKLILCNLPGRHLSGMACGHFEECWGRGQRCHPAWMLFTPFIWHSTVALSQLVTSLRSPLPRIYGRVPGCCDSSLFMNRWDLRQWLGGGVQEETADFPPAQSG